MVTWTSVKDSLPTKDGKYLVFIPTSGEPFTKIIWYDLDSGWSLSFDYWIGAITHWIPLPGSPVVI